MAHERVVSFFDSYRAAFERFDVEAIADHFAFPLHIVGESKPVDLRCVGSREEWLETLAMLLDLYRGFGVTTAEVLHSSMMELSEHVAQAVMHWSLRTGSDDEIYDFHGIYTLVEVDGDYRIAAIAHDELGEITAKLA